MVETNNLNANDLVKHAGWSKLPPVPAEKKEETKTVEVEVEKAEEAKIEESKPVRRRRRKSSL